MNDDDSAADRRVAELLAALRTDPPTSPALRRRVVDTARWQQVVIAPLRAIGTFGGAVVEGVRTLLGARRADR